MIRQLYAALSAIAIFTASCSSQKPLAQDSGITKNARKLSVKMNVNYNAINDRSVPLTFVVTNPTNKPIMFCKWETPFEPRIGKYFEIINAQGNEVAFKGAMARRVMPPPAEAYIQVPAHGRVVTKINLANNYVLNPGRYTVRYTGGGVSGLRSGNTIKIAVAMAN